MPAYKEIVVRVLYDPPTGVKILDESLLLHEFIADKHGTYYHGYSDKKYKVKEFRNKLFVFDNTVYKIKHIKIKPPNAFIPRFTYIAVIERRADNPLAGMVKRVNSARQHMLVCADSVEDLGLPGVARDLRARAENLGLENIGQ